MLVFVLFLLEFLHEKFRNLKPGLEKTRFKFQFLIVVYSSASFLAAKSVKTDKTFLVYEMGVIIFTLV